MTHPRSGRTLIAFLLLTGTFLSVAYAQSIRGSMSGTITDPSGAVIGGAKIVAHNVETNNELITNSTSTGDYRFPEMPLGRYNVSVSAPGFKQAVRQDVLVQVQNVTALSVTLELGENTQTVTVNASAPRVQTESSDVGGVIGERQILDLPLAVNGGVGALRSPEAFVFLLPGTTGPGTAGSNNGIFISKISGGQNFANEVLLDGASQTRSENGSSFDEEAPSVEALQEFKITTALPQAEYGRTTGGIENFVTKSGTSTFHGHAYEILRNEALDSNGWFNNGRLAQCAPGDAACRKTNSRQVDKKNDYGGTLGGPVYIPKLYNGRDKTFFFFSWEQLKYNQGAVQTTTVPTLAMRSGDFSSPQILRTDLGPIGTNPCNGQPVYQGEIFDPATQRVVNGVACRDPFPGNKIDPARFSAVAKNILPFYPTPSNSAQFNNYNLASSIPLANTTYTIRIDESLNVHHRIFASYSARENSRTSGGNPILPDPVDPNTWKQDFLTHFGRGGWDWIISPNLLNHLTFGSNRSNSINKAQAIFAGVNWSQQVGINNVNSLNFPQIVTNESIANLGNPPQNNDNIDNGLRLLDSINWTRGRHNFKFGGDLRWQQYSPINGNSPAFNFNRPQTAAYNNSTVTGLSGNGFASFLLGDVGTSGQNIVALQPRWTSWYWAIFAQDDLKVTRNLTLNLGIRYDVDMPRTEAHNATSNFSPTANDPEYNIPGALVFGTTCNCNTRWANTWYKDIAPRLGFAYSPPWLNGKTALRGGFGILYGPLQYADFGGAMNTGYKANVQQNAKDNFTAAYSIDSGFPSFTPPPNLDAGFFNGTPVANNYITPTQGRPAMVYEWSLQLQQELAPDLILSVGYLGNKAQNLRSSLANINNIPIGDFALGDKLNQTLAGNTAGVNEPFTGFTTLWGPGVQVQQALRPFPQYAYIASDCCLQNKGMSTYNALLVSLQRNFRNGLNLLASYTWSKNITNADSALPGINAGIQQIQNPDNLRQEKSISSQDIPQTFVVSWLYELPFGPDHRFLNHGLLGSLVGGWELGGIQRYMSGAPISFGCTGTGIPGWDNCIRFSRVPGQSLKSVNYSNLNPFDATRNSMFNRAAFVDPNSAAIRGGGAYTFGNLPRVTGEIRDYRYLNEDFSLIKNTRIHERLNFELKFDLLNAFNRHTFTIPDTEPNNVNTFGVPTGTLQGSLQRVGQITGRITF